MTETLYIHRVSIAIPEALYPDFQHLEGCWGEGMSDHLVDRPARYQDAQGNRYMVVSTAATARLLERPGAPVERPEYDTEVLIDIEAAEAARAALIVWPDGVSETGPLATPLTITAYVDVEPAAAFLAMGLTAIPAE